MNINLNYNYNIGDKGDNLSGGENKEYVLHVQQLDVQNINFRRSNIILG